MHHLQKLNKSLRCRSITYLVIAKDYPQSNFRRMQVRPDHLERTTKAKQQGLILLGGATLSKSKEMDGSVVLFEAESEEAVQDYLKSDPYVLNKVWESWEVEEFKLAGVSPKLVVSS